MVSIPDDSQAGWSPAIRNNEYRYKMNFKNINIATYNTYNKYIIIINNYYYKKQEIYRSLRNTAVIFNIYIYIFTSIYK